MSSEPKAVESGIDALLGKSYRHGFVTDIDSDTLPPGLDEDVVRFISRKKREPQFMTEWRLKAYRHWLTMREGSLWGLCTNGVTLRLVRDNESLTRPAYIEADLRLMFEDEAYADFALLWLLVHASRFGGARRGRCPIARWSAGAMPVPRRGSPRVTDCATGSRRPC